MSDEPSQRTRSVDEQAAFRALADAFSPLVALIQGDKVVYVNPAGCALLGYTREDFVGRDFWVFARAHDHESVRERVRSRQSGAAPAQRFTQRLEHSDGHVVWIDYSIDVIQLDGEPTTLVTGHDITEQKRAEDALRVSEARFREAFYNAGIGKAIVTPDLRFKQVNRAYCEMFGYAESELLTMSPADLTDSFDRDEGVELIRSLLASEAVSGRVVRRYRHKDGHIVWGELTLTLLRDEADEPMFFIGEVVDVSDRRQAEEALRTSEELFRTAFQHTAIGKAITSPDLRVVQVNDAACRMSGRSEAEMLSMTPLQMTHPEDRAQNMALIQRLLAGEATHGTITIRFLHPERGLMWGEQTRTLVRDAQGRPSFFISETVDVTERKEAERLLREREASLAEAQRVAQLGSWEYNITSDSSVWSDQMYRIFGVDPATFRASRENAFARYHPDDLPAIKHIVERAIEHGTAFEFESRIVRDDGEIRTLWTVGHAGLDASGRPYRLYGVLQDITERRLAEEALRASERRFRNIYTQAPVMMTVVGPDGCFREVSNFWLARMGYERDEVIGREAHAFVTPESFARLREEYERCSLAGETVARSTPIVGVARDGTHVHLLVTSVLELDERARFQGVVTVGMDVTHIRRAEEAIRESEARYRALVEHAQEAILVVDAETGMFMDANDAATQTFGYTREQFLGMRPPDIAPERQPDGSLSTEFAQRQIALAHAGGTPGFEWSCRHASGREMVCLVRLSLLPAQGRALIRSVVTDITELKLLQEKARHDDRLSAIGVLAAGVAHEIGNPLLALSMAVQSLERKAADEYAQKKLGLIREHIERISKIVRQMSDLARPRVPLRSACDMNRVIERALEIIRYDKRAKEVAIRFEPCGEAPLVRAVEDHLMQVCLNLGLNALDAVATNAPQRPRALTIRTRRVERNGRAFVRAGFADSGPGIPETARARIFQPFFTTKEPGKGTGLGLSVSYRIIEEHEGRLAFECPAESGTEFYFELPAQETP